MLIVVAMFSCLICKKAGTLRPVKSGTQQNDNDKAKMLEFIRYGKASGDARRCDDGNLLIERS
jgi:hypothetical protein